LPAAFPQQVSALGLFEQRSGEQCVCHDTLPWLISFSLDHAVNWEAISAIGQIVGAIGVVVSLIYVATEVRNSARATQLASRRSISEIFTQLSRQLAEHPDLRELYYRGLHDFESLEGTDLVGFAQVMLQLFRAYEEAYYGHLDGDVDPRLAWVGSGHARYQRISWSSGLLAFTLALVQ
jgi:hypothetical protein